MYFKYQPIWKQMLCLSWIMNKQNNRFVEAPQYLQEFTSSQTFTFWLMLNVQLVITWEELLYGCREGMKLFEEPESERMLSRSSSNFSGHATFSIFYARQVNILKKPRRSQIDATASSTCTLANDNTNARYVSKCSGSSAFEFVWITIGLSVW